MLSFLPALECDLRPANRWEGGGSGGREQGREGVEGVEGGGSGGREVTKDKSKSFLAVQTYLRAGVN